MTNIKDLMPPKGEKFYFYSGKYTFDEKHEPWRPMSGTVGVAANDSPSDAYQSIVLKWIEVLTEQKYAEFSAEFKTQKHKEQLKNSIRVVLNKFHNVQ